MSRSILTQPVTAHEPGVPLAAVWPWRRQLWRWLAAHPMPPRQRGRPKQPSQGWHWRRYHPQHLMRFRWMAALEPDGTVTAVRWVHQIEEGMRHHVYCVVLGEAADTGLWHINGTAAAWRMMGLWIPELGGSIPVVRFFPGWPESVGPFGVGQAQEEWPTLDVWRRYLIRHQWVTPAEWRAWFATASPPAAAQSWPALIWLA